MLKNLMSAAAIAAALTMSVSALAGTERLSPAQSRALELSLKDTPAGPRAESLLATVNYSDTTVGGTSWSRPFADCTGTSGLGPVTLHMQQFTVTVAGNYAVSSAQTGGWDGYIFVYQNAFNPAAPNTNCIIGDDDGAGGIGTSDIDSVALVPGVLYFLITTGFEAGEEGAFTNTISGPGDINLGGGVGPSANLGITKSAPDGVVNGGNYRYSLGANNAGPDPATGVTVTDVLPAGVTFVSSTCGATAAGQTVTWNIGAMANAGTANCELTVNRAATMCSTVSNTASISGTEPDPSPANNSATHSNGGGNLVVDGGFEVASAPAWTQASSNFGTPLCDAGCGTGGGTAGPRTGAQWMWFGGAGTAMETGSAEQAVTIPSGANSLSFGYWLGTCGTGGAADFIRLTVGGTEVWRRDATSAECAAPGYSLATVDITALATGVSRVIRFESTSGTAGDNSNFHIDDVSLPTAPVCVAPANADLALAQTVTAVGSQSIGSTVNLAWTVSNSGPGSASAVTVSTTLPAQLSFTGSSCGATAMGQTVSWNVGALANGANASCTVSTAIAQAGSISVSSTVASSTSDPVTANNSATGGLTGALPPATRPAVVPTLSQLGLLALVLSVLALAGFSLIRRNG